MLNFGWIDENTGSILLLAFILVVVLPLFLLFVSASKYVSARKAGDVVNQKKHRTRLIIIVCIVLALIILRSVSMRSASF